MDDYISREAVLMQLCNRHCATGSAECLFKITHNGDPGCFTAHDILKIPPADVRPVVCCRDCGYFKEAKVNSKGFLICPASGMEITDDDFCSYAERGADMRGGDADERARTL